MKLINKVGIAGTILAILFASGCSGEASKSASVGVGAEVSEESLGLRKTDLYSEDSTAPSKTEYRSADAGASTKIKRAFQDAPPMIPHGTEGMLPIKIGNNACTGCHMPDVAMYMDPKPTPIPVSHFTNFRPTHNFDGKTFTKSIDNMKNEMSIKKTDRLQGARFNCSQCHAPQSQGNLAVENTFEANYTKADGANRSSWNGSALTDSLDTIKGEGGKVTKKDVENKNSPAGASAWTHH